MQNAVIYARYSSDKQTDDSIEAQLRACKDYAATKQYSIINTYVDQAISGKTSNRSQYQKMLKDCDKGIFGTILIHKYDRIARNLSEHVNLEQKLKEKEITLIATAQDFGSSNEAKIMRSLMWSLSEYYIDNLAGETRKGLKETALKGLHTGGYAPFGYDVVNQKYVINELESFYVKKIFDCALNQTGFTEIIKEMQACGITGKRGKPIQYAQIYEMLRNEKYTGTYSYSPTQEKNRHERRNKPHAIRVENALEPIISKEQFLEVREIMSKRKQTGKKAAYLCSGLVFCKCGAKMHGMKSQRKGHVYLYFNCSKHCGAPVIHMQDIDYAAKNYLSELLSPKNQKELSNELHKYKNGTTNQLKDFKAILQKKILEKQNQYNTLIKNLSSQTLPSEIISDIGQRMQTIKLEMKALQNTTPPNDYTAQYITTWLDALKTNPDEKAIRLLIERIDVKSTTDIRITSTLTSVVGNFGCGSQI